MSEEFPSPPEEVQRLARELELLRSDFQGALSKLSQMDKRLRAAFPTLPKSSKKQKPQPNLPASLKKSEELMAIFDEMVTLKREQNDSDFEARLHDLPPEDVVALAVELGAGKGKKTSVKAAQEGIRGRANETILLNKSRQVAERPPSRYS
jgi:predicted  nucleic acid-binding Zn-ribbon protein